MVIEAPEGASDAVKAIFEWAQLAITDLHYRVRISNGERVYVIVPSGLREHEAYSRAEAVLIAYGMELDWRNHPDELVRRTIADTLRTVGEWLPEGQRELVEGPAFGIRGWVPAGYSCPVCQHTRCEADCPVRRVGVRPMFAAPAVAYLTDGGVRAPAPYTCVEGA